MTALLFCLSVAIAFLLGSLWHATFGGRWITVRDPHFLSDPEHLRIRIRGLYHRFTDDQLRIARDRELTRTAAEEG
jgi:hypothetical protein